MSRDKQELPAPSSTLTDEPSKRKKTKPSLPPLTTAPDEPESAFSAYDFKQLSENEHQRFAPNSKKIGHAVIVMEGGTKTAIQYDIPDEAEEAPKVRPLINIEEIEPFRGMHRYRAETPVGRTPMFAKRIIDGMVGTALEGQPIQIACFSPNDQKGKPQPFWGSIKETPLFRTDLAKGIKKDLDKDVAEMGKSVKGGDVLLIDPDSVPKRDLIKTRKPDQNTVMGESARDAYENFFDRMIDELHPDMKSRLKRAFSADIKEGFYKNSYRPEWLHAYGWSLMPMSEDPQTKDNLGAAPKWSNTQMMILERIVKWFALKSPETLLSIQPKFEMLLDSDLIQHIDFKVKLELKDRYIELMQKIDPFLAFPLFPKASDIAQGTAISHSILHGAKPRSQQAIGNREQASVPMAKLPLSSPMPARRLSQRQTAPTVAEEVPSTAFLTRAPVEKTFPSQARKKTLVESVGTVPIVEPSRGAKLKKRRPGTPEIVVPPHEKSAVQIYTTCLAYDYDNPWRAPEEASCTGSGVILEHEGRKYILTNAHVVENHIYLRVRLANDRKRKYEATAKCVSYQSDLALLEVDDPEFQMLSEPAEFGEMVASRQKVMTVGFPMGGNEISVSKGIVSRIEVRDYCMSGLDMLQVQVDAAINPGNSGGPVFSNHEVVGLAFQGYDKQGLGYMIPIPIIQHFLKEAFSGKKYRGYPVLPIIHEELENDEQRRFYQLGEQTGVRIKSIDNLSDAYSKLKPDDILLAIDGMPISNEGTIDVDGVGKCIAYVHAMHSKFIGDNIRLKVLRKNPLTQLSEIHEIDVILDTVPGDTEKVGVEEHDKMPTYFIHSGICFQPLTRNYMESAGSDFEEMHTESGISIADAPKILPDEQIVVISHILACKATHGYDHFINEVVKFINGQPINHMQDVVRAMESNPSGVHEITLASKSKLIIENMSEDKLGVLLKRHHIPAARSDDLKPAAVGASAAPLSLLKSTSALAPTLGKPTPQGGGVSLAHGKSKDVGVLKRKRQLSAEEPEDSGYESDASASETSAEDEPPVKKRTAVAIKASVPLKRKRVISDEEDEVENEAEVAANLSATIKARGGMMDGMKRYLATLDDMEERYKGAPVEDEEEDDDFEENLDSDASDEEDEDDEASLQSDEAEEVDEEEALREEAATPPLIRKPSAPETLPRFFQPAKKPEEKMASMPFFSAKPRR